MRYQHYSRQAFQKYRPKRRWREWFASKRRLAPSETVGVARHQTKRAEAKTAFGERRYHALFIIFLIALGVWIILLLSLPYFRVTSIGINGHFNLLSVPAIEAATQKLIAPRWWWPRNNYFLIPLSKIKTALKLQYPLIRDVNVQKIFPGRLDVAITEKKIAFILDTRQQLFLVDATGLAVKDLGPISLPASSTTTAPPLVITSTTIFAVSSSTPATNTRHIYRPPFSEYQKKYGNYLVVYDDQERAVVENTIAINADIAPKIIEIQQLAKTNLNATVNFVIIHSGGREGAELYLNKPWYVLFNPLQDIALQVRRLQTIVQNKKPAQYVDVRFGDHVYWK